MAALKQRKSMDFLVLKIYGFSISADLAGHYWRKK